MVQNFNASVDITKSDTVDIAGPKQLTDAIFVGTGGTVTVVYQSGATQAYTVATGGTLFVQAKRVNSTGTAAALMVAQYQI